MARMSKQFGFLGSILEDPRRIELRQAEILEAYQQRGGYEDIVELCADLTKLRPSDSSNMVDALMLFQQPFMQAVQYTHDPDYPLQPRRRLPKPNIPDGSLRELLCSRRSVRNFAGDAFGQTELGSLLFGAIGETGRTVTGHEGNHPVYACLRSIPSAGALHPTELFVAMLQENEFPRGVYHYYAPEHSLEFVKPIGHSGMELKRLFAAFPIHPRVVDLTHASAIFFISTKFWRARAKYGPRGYRYCLLEAGCACQNLGLTAVGLGLAHVVLGGFYDDEIHAFLEIDGVDHAVLVAMAVGTPPAEHQEESHHVEF
jgi:SagB-type dehydrogenase family enzyme